MKNEIRAIPEREATTAVQVNTLLSIAGTMMGALLVPNNSIAEPHHATPELDGGSKSAAEMTFITCCNTLTDMLNDKSRWGLEVTRVLEMQAVKINQQHIAVLAAQKQAVDGLSTPSYRFKPSLVRLSDGMYCAFIGESPQDALCGIGRTAEEAFAAFDEVFAGQIPEEMINYLITQEEKLKNEKTQDAEVVRARPQNPKKTKSRRRKPRGNS